VLPSYSRLAPNSFGRLRAVGNRSSLLDAIVVAIDVPRVMVDFLRVAVGFLGLWTELSALAGAEEIGRSRHSTTGSLTLSNRRLGSLLYNSGGPRGSGGLLSSIGNEVVLEPDSTGIDALKVDLFFHSFVFVMCTDGTELGEDLRAFSNNLVYESISIPNAVFYDLLHVCVFFNNVFDLLGPGNLLASFMHCFGRLDKFAIDVNLGKWIRFIPE